MHDMTRPQLTIRDRMTPLTHSIGDEQPMAEAARRMRAQRIRHLPVLRGGRLLGILSTRDLSLVESLAGVDPEHVPVSQAMTEAPYAVSPDTSLFEVLEQMATHKYGAALVVEGEKPVGIFTTIDALDLARELLSEQS
jgi:acetoin utilization protein AcuB